MGVWLNRKACTTAQHPALDIVPAIILVLIVFVIVVVIVLIVEIGLICITGSLDKRGRQRDASIASVCLAITRVFAVHLGGGATRITANFICGSTRRA
jgi:hypothetical protein